MRIVACPMCQKPMQLPDDATGKRCKCLSCNEVFIVPSLPEEVSRPPVPASTPSDFSPVIERRIEKAQLKATLFSRELVRVQELLRTDPDMALTKCRQILESSVYQLHKTAIGNPGTKRLEQLIADLARQAALPRKIVALCEVVRELGNVGTHPIYDDEKPTHQEAQIALLSLIVVLDWFRRSQAPGVGAGGTV
jgi:hypothetical protein